jgi:hypothetical protein
LIYAPITAQPAFTVTLLREQQHLISEKFMGGTGIGRALNCRHDRQLLSANTS